jgi:Cdc6-like AAA superfamily ATPase
MDWQALEKLVRLVAESKFGCLARAEDIAGIKCDCILHVGDGSVVIIEISKEDTLDKLRTDLAKFNVLRPHFIQQNIHPRCFFVTLNEPTPSLIASGKVNFVQVYSLDQFFDAMVGFSEYATLRQKSAFGSAIDLYSGKPDSSKFVPVEYADESGQTYTPDDIASLLSKGRNIVLVGDYGTGKSRCTKEVFAALTARQHNYQYPVAINLRDNWGLKRASEVITRHFSDLGLASRVDDILKVAYSPANVYLLVS